jgi:hypothetical protein
LSMSGIVCYFGAGCLLLGACCWVLVAGSWVLVTDYRSLITDYKAITLIPVSSQNALSSS